MNATLFFGGRVRAKTLWRFRLCRRIARALGDGATTDKILAEALHNYSHLLRYRCRKRGVELSPEGSDDTGRDGTPFDGVPVIRPRIDE